MMSGFFFFKCDTKCLRQSTYKEKDLFLAPSFGDSVWIWPVIWGYGEAVHHGTNIQRAKPLTLGSIKPE